MPATCRAAVLDGPGQPLRLASVPMISPPPGYVLAKVRMAGLCGSDLHTFTGRRVEPTPIILGHEVVAEVAILGERVRESAAGQPLHVGDRISFAIMASCGRCATCRRGLPQKCESLFKYGHSAFDNGIGLSGGFAEYIYLRPGTAIFHVPSALSDEEACPANCALATVLNGLESLGVRSGERVLIQGAGLLGLYAAAVAGERGASQIVVTDIDESRLDMAKRFGADQVLNVRGMGEQKILRALGPDRFDCVAEVCGDPSAVWPGLQMLGLGGRYVIIGLVCAGSTFTIDGNTIARNYLTLKGIHNYAPGHLAAALAFLEKTRSRFPYKELISRVLPLAAIQTAFETAAEKRGIRVAVKP